MPRTLLAQIPEHGIRRVLRSLETELTHRSAEELAARIAVCWESWRYRTEDITDPTAVAIAITRRGYQCPNVRCEVRINLDTGVPCKACAPPDPATDAPSAPQPLDHPTPAPHTTGNPSRAVSGTYTPPPVIEVLSAPPAGQTDDGPGRTEFAEGLAAMRAKTKLKIVGRGT
jgi:hypothetical protein